MEMFWELFLLTLNTFISVLSHTIDVLHTFSFDDFSYNSFALSNIPLLRNKSANFAKKLGCNNATS